MTISKIYSRYHILPNLVQHMYRVTACGQWILDHWTGPEVNKYILVSALLLHDTGNIIKFQMDKRSKLLGSEAGRLNFWQKVQKGFIEKYGTDEHQATIEIAKEIKVSPKVVKLIESMSDPDLSKLISKPLWSTIIAYYADYRAGPFGVVTLDQRINDLVARYKNSGHALGKVKLMEKKRSLLKRLEMKLQALVDNSLVNLNDKAISSYLNSLPSHRVRR